MIGRNTLFLVNTIESLPLLYANALYPPAHVYQVEVRSEPRSSTLWLTFTNLRVFLILQEQY